MANISEGEIIRVVLSYNGPGASVAQNVFYFECQDAAAEEQTALQDVSDWFVANWLAEWDGVAADTAEAFLIEMDILNGDGTVDRNIGDDDISVFGTQASDVLPAAVSGYMQADSERGGSLGRKYVPFVSENAPIDGLYGAGTTAFFADMLVDWITTITVDIAAHFVPGILSRITESFQEFLGSGYTTNVPAYQRRRKPNVGS